MYLKALGCLNIFTSPFIKMLHESICKGILFHSQLGPRRRQQPSHRRCLHRQRLSSKVIKGQSFLASLEVNTFSREALFPRFNNRRHRLEDPISSRRLLLSPINRRCRNLSHRRRLALWPARHLQSNIPSLRQQLTSNRNLKTWHKIHLFRRHQELDMTLQTCL